MNLAPGPLRLVPSLCGPPTWPPPGVREWKLVLDEHCGFARTATESPGAAPGTVSLSIDGTGEKYIGPDPWGYLLEYAARAGWRVREVVPPGAESTLEVTDMVSERSVRAHAVLMKLQRLVRRFQRRGMVFDVYNLTAAATRLVDAPRDEVKVRRLMCIRARRGLTCDGSSRCNCDIPW